MSSVVMITGVDSRRGIDCVKAIRRVETDLSLKDAKDIFDYVRAGAGPKVVVVDICHTVQTATRILRDAGCEVSLPSSRFLAVSFVRGTARRVVGWCAARLGGEVKWL
jgi:hypothetical protein